MPLSLHAAFVPTALQMLGVTRGLVDKAEEWCTANGKDEAELIGCRLIEDMLPFTYQVKSVALHTAGAIEGVKAGEFQPDFADPPSTFAGLRERLDGAIATLEATTEEELEALIGKEMAFVVPDRLHLDFTAENFLLSFSQPNYMFHAATAYDLLRERGIEVGKREWLGAMRVKA